jgi:mxaA protein
LLLLLAVAICPFANRAADRVEIRVEDARAFGHMVGDVVERHIVISAPRPLTLAQDSLPKPGRVGYGLELRDAMLAGKQSRDHTQYDLLLRYQVFAAPTEPKTLDLPAFTLQLDGGGQPEELRIDFAPIVISPLSPSGLSLRKGLGGLRPDFAPPLLDTRPALWRLAACATVAMLLLGYMAYVYLGIPFLTRRRRPFTVAYRQLRDLKVDAGGDKLRYGMKRLHHAFNETAGRTIFQHDVEPFLSAHPGFAPLGRDIAAFFDDSRKVFFATETQAAPEDIQRLLALCRHCRDIERGVV